MSDRRLYRQDSGVADKMMGIGALIIDIDGVVTNGWLPYGLDGESNKFFNTRDDVGIGLAQAAGWPVGVVTARRSPMVSAWTAEHGLTEVSQEIGDKRAVVAETLAKWQVAPSACAYLGDDLLDLPAMMTVGLSAAPSDAALLVRRKVDLVLQLPGGFGCLRELVERILEVQGGYCRALREYYRRAGVTDLGDLLPDDDADSGPLGPKIGFR